MIFSDGDCLFPPDFLAQHLHLRRPAVACTGDRVRMDQRSTDRLDFAAIASGAYQAWVPWPERRGLWTRWVKDLFYQTIRHPAKPKLTGCNFGVWRSDFQRVNGFDECFVGWGCEDDDLAQRLRSCGVRIASIVRHARLYHMWHPADITAPPKWREGRNVPYFPAPGQAGPLRTRPGGVNDWRRRLCACQQCRRFQKCGWVGSAKPVFFGRDSDRLPVGTPRPRRNSFAANITAINTIRRWKGGCMGAVKKFLARKTLQDRERHNSRLFVDLCENIHIHYREYRLIFSLDEYFEFVDIVGKSTQDVRNYLYNNPDYKEDEYPTTIMIACGKDRQRKFLKNSPLPHKSAYHNDNFAIELQEEHVTDEIHVHWRDLRIALNRENFKDVAEAFMDAHRNLTEFEAQQAYSARTPC